MKVYAWIENGQLFTTEDKNLAPANAIELEVASFDDVIYDGTQIRLKTETEKLAEEKERKLAELKNYVASLFEQTDYIIVRIAEAQVRGDEAEVERLRQRYARQLQEREVIRQWNEQMKQAIRNAKTLEELRSIEIKYG
jgi:mevalonate kinase